MELKASLSGPSIIQKRSRPYLHWQRQVIDVDDEKDEARRANLKLQKTLEQMKKID